MCKKKHSDGESTFGFHPRDNQDEGVESLIEEINKQLNVKAIKGEFMFHHDGKVVFRYDGFIINDSGEIRDWRHFSEAFEPYEEVCTWIESKLTGDWRLATLNEVRKTQGDSDDNIRELAKNLPEGVKLDG